MSENTYQPLNHQKQDELLTEAALIKLLETQTEELKLRQEEMRLRVQEQQNDYDISRENLRLQAEYLRSAPKYKLRNRILFAALLAVALLIISGVFIYCVHANKQDIAIRILETLITSSGAYAWGKSQKPKNGEEPISHDI